MERRRLGRGGPEVSAVGLGCMGMSDAYGPSDEGESIATIREAVDRGVTFLNTGDFYGMGHNETLIARAIEGLRDKLFISVKFGALRSPDGQTPTVLVSNLPYNVAVPVVLHVLEVLPSLRSEVARYGLRVVGDDRHGRLLGLDGVAAAQPQPDRGGVEQAEELLVLGLVRAGGIAPGVTASLVELDPQLAAHL